MLYVAVEMNWRYHYKRFDYENWVLWPVLQVREVGQALRKIQGTVLLLLPLTENYANQA